MARERALLLAAVGAALTLALSAPPAEERVQSPTEPCCFRNPAYAGTCKVQPAEDETCASILAYLNNPMAEGKSYCGGTTVRQGWTLVSCEEQEP